MLFAYFHLYHFNLYLCSIVPSGELEITRVEESPLLDNSEELVSGNLAGMNKVKGKIADFDENDDDDLPTSSTQINRSSSKRLALHTSSEDTASTDDDLSIKRPSSFKRSNRGKPKPVEQPKPQRKSRRLDSSTGGSTSDDSTKSTRNAKKRSKV